MDVWGSEKARRKKIRQMAKYKNIRIIDRHAYYVLLT